MSKRGLISGLTLCIALLIMGCNQPNTPSSTGNSTQKSNYANATLEEGDAAFKEKKYDVAEGIFAKFCSAGNIEACVQQGEVYTKSDALKNTAKALSLFQNACEKGNGRGCNQLGTLYMSNAKEGNDALKGMEYFKKSCQNGFYSGCYNTAFYYALGTSRKEIPHDIALAVEFMSKACLLGDQSSCEDTEELKYRLSLNGKAKFTNKMMDTKYEGDFVNGKYHGKGKLVWENVLTYEGDFVNGQRTGKGVEILSNGDRYEGDFVKNYKFGKGINIFKDNDVWEGEWINDKLSGYGIVRTNKNDAKTINSYPKYSGNYEGDFYVIKGEFKDGKFAKSAPMPMELQQRIDADAKIDFTNAQKTATAEAYINFLTKRPNSTYTSQIVALLDKKLEPEYKRIASAKDLDALREFSTKYVYSTKSEESKKLVEFLEKEKEYLKFIFKDSATGLVWQDDTDVVSNKDFSTAIVYCENLKKGKFSGYDDWRLPNVYELLTLLDNENAVTSISGLKMVSRNAHWSSSISSANSSQAWSVGFGSGKNYQEDKDVRNNVRCVAGKSLNYDMLSSLKKKGVLKVAQNNIDDFSPTAEAKRKKEAEIVAQREAKERAEREKIAAKERAEREKREAERRRNLFQLGNKVCCMKYYSQNSGWCGSIENISGDRVQVEVTDVTVNGFLKMQLNATECSGNKTLNYDSRGKYIWVPKSCID